MRDAPSIAQSSPSVYAATLPLPTDDYVDARRPYQDATYIPEATRQDFVIDAPPRPPRSQLRDTILKSGMAYPMTPPISTSTSSHSHTHHSDPYERTPGMPEPKGNSNSQGVGGKGPEDILSRRTLLDVSGAACFSDPDSPSSNSQVRPRY